MGLFGGDSKVTTTFVGKDEMTPVVRSMKSTMDDFKKNAMKGFGIGAGLSVFGLATKGIGLVTDAVGAAINAASDLNESESKVNVVFGAQKAIIDDWARHAASSMGMSQQAALEAAGTFGNLFEGLGLTQQAASGMSQKVVQLAADLASFNNVPVEDALRALQSGLLGEAEPMRQFGVALDEASTKAYAMAHGLGTMVKHGKTFTFTMTNAEKVQARWGQIIQHTKNAQGDFIRSSGNLAEKQKTLDANIQNLTAHLGQLLTGPLSDIIGGLSGMVSQFDTSSLSIDKATQFVNSYGDALDKTTPKVAALVEAQKVDKLKEYADAYQAWVDEFAPGVQQTALSLTALNGAAGQFDIVQWMTDLNKSLAMASGGDAAVISLIATHIAELGGSFSDFVLEVQRMAANNFDIKGMAESWQTSFDYMSMSVEQFTTLWLQGAKRVQAGKETWQEWGQFLVRNTDYVSQHFAELPGWMQKVLVQQGIVAEENLQTLSTTFKRHFGSIKRTYVTDLSPLASITKKTMADAVTEAKAGAAAYKDAMEHPLRGEKLAKFYERQITLAGQRARKAQREHNARAYAIAEAALQRWRGLLGQYRQAAMSASMSFSLVAGGEAGRGTTSRGGDAAPVGEFHPGHWVGTGKKRHWVNGKAIGGTASGTFVAGEYGPELIQMGSAKASVQTAQASRGNGAAIILDGQVLGRWYDRRLGMQLDLA